MPGCIVCGHDSVRRRRSLFRKITDRAIFRCQNCGDEIAVRRSFFSLFGRYCECPECGNRDVSKLASRDRIDRMNRNPLRRSLFFLGAPLYHCTFCRLQFRDWRARESDQRKASAATPGA